MIPVSRLAAGDQQKEITLSDPDRIVVSGDDPVQIAGSPNLDRLAPYGEVMRHDGRPQNNVAV